MQSCRLFSLSRLSCLLLLCFGSLLTVAQSKGTVRVQQTNGTVQIYNNVAIDIVGRTLRLTTADGKGTLVIDRAACSYSGEIQVCLPYQATLRQRGTSNPINIAKGTAYVNLTGVKQQLSLSSTQLPSRGILMAIRTKAGTYLTLTGEIDQVPK